MREINGEALSVPIARLLQERPINTVISRVQLSSMPKPIILSSTGRILLPALAEALMTHVSQKVARQLLVAEAVMITAIDKQPR